MKMLFENIEIKRKYHREYYHKHREDICKRTHELRILNKDYINARKRKWWAKNRDKIVEWHREYRKKNKNRIKAYHEKYRLNHRKKTRQSSKEFAIRHPERVRINGMVQKARRKNAGKLSVKNMQRVYEDNIKKYGTLTCVLCNKPILFGDDSLEHLIPISRGGTNKYKNLGIAHLLCNKQKESKTMEEWKLCLKYMSLKNKV